MNLFKKQNLVIGAIGFLIGSLISQGVSATNVLKIGSWSVQPATEFIVQIEADNSDPFVAFQADIPIPAGFTYKENSAQLNVTRISGHSLSASLLAGNVLRLIGFSVSNTAFSGTSGVLVSFALKSGTVPSSYPLALNQAMIGDSQSNNILTSTVNGSVTVLAPNIKLSGTELNYGRVPLGTSPQLSFQITNDGNSDLIVSSINFNDTQFSTTDATGFTIGANSSRSISVKFTPTAKATIDKQIQINSNDPDQPIATVSLKAVAFAVNELHTGTITGASSSNGTLDFTINNMEAFTGFQFDLNLPTPMTYSAGIAQLFRSQDHTVSVNQLNVNTLRVLVFSAGNQNFTGISGKVLSLNFALNGIAGWYSVNVSNVIIASTVGENIVSASFGGSLQITAPDIDAPTSLSFGDVSILSESTKNLRINNYGQEPLIITQLMFPNDYFSSSQTFPLTINKNSYFDLPLKFKKVTKSSETATLKIVSNDPDENPFNVQLSGNAFVPNYLLIKAQTITIGETKNVPVEIENEEPFVAFQFDLKYPAGLTPDLNAIALTVRKQDHAFAAISLSANSIRILVYSIGQKEFTGKTGAVMNIPFKCDINAAVGSFPIEFSNALISNISSENILYSATNGTIAVSQIPQVLSLNIGWNIISANIVPSNPDMKTIFQPLIDASKLKKVMDESGKAIENFGAFGGWKNSIGNLISSKGYKVNVTEACTLRLEGLPVSLPMDINLTTGWNIISYPTTLSQDAMTIFQPLIIAGKLKKVMDESGKAIEDFGALGGWKNNIGNLNPGKGYKVNMTTAGTLTIPAGGTKSAVVLPGLMASTHFKTAFRGNGTDHININMVELANCGIKEGDEIGVFDGKVCVGSATIGLDQILNDNISLTASANDQLEVQANGFTPGHTILLKLFRDNLEQLLFPELLNNSTATFAKGESLFAKVSLEQITGLSELASQPSVKCYPNPFSEQVSIEIELTQPQKLTVNIYDANGKLVRRLFKGKAEGGKVLVWDGKNESGAKMVAGMYFCHVNQIVTKMIFKK
jgi:hypothetical protein